MKYGCLHRKPGKPDVREFVTGVGGRATYRHRVEYRFSTSRKFSDFPESNGMMRVQAVNEVRLFTL